MSDDTLGRLRKAKAALKKRLANHPDVQALGVGYRERSGKVVQRGCIRVYVREKRPLDTIPRNRRLPRSVNGVPVDVVEAGFVAHAVRPVDRCDPVIGGIVVTGTAQFRASGKVGTVGCVVSPLGRPLLLSCWHVLYGPTGQNGDPIVQPTPSGTLNNIGANVVGIISNRVDCAVAELDATRGTSPTILDLPAAVMTQTTARPGLLVSKSGANGIGRGVVISVDTDPPVNVGGQVRVFDDQIEIVPRPGQTGAFNTGAMDSGALWISDDDGGVVGLHFAGGGSRALANPITAVVDALAQQGVSLGL